MTHLVRHSLERKAPGREQLLRYRNGKPITYRRYDHLWMRVRGLSPWADAHQISTHWLRHTTLTWVERNFGEAVARAYAGHAEPKGDSGVTAVYVRANRSRLR
jgi:integrase